MRPQIMPTEFYEILRDRLRVIDLEIERLKGKRDVLTDIALEIGDYKKEQPKDQQPDG